MSVEIFTQKKSDVIAIIQEHLRSMDKAIDDAEIKTHLDNSIQLLEKAKQAYIKLEKQGEQAETEYKKHTEKPVEKKEGGYDEE